MEYRPSCSLICCLWLLSCHDSRESHCDKKNLQTAKYRIFTLHPIQKFAKLCHRALTSEQSTSTLLISSPLFPVCFPLLSKVICHFSKCCFIPFRVYERPTLEPAFSNQKKPKEEQCQRMFKLPHNCTHLTR